MNAGHAAVDGERQIGSSGLVAEGTRSAKLVSRFKKFPLVTGSIVIVISGIVLLGGYVFGISELKNFAPNLPKMVPNTAFGLLAAAISLLLYATRFGKPVWYGSVWIPRILAVLVVTLGTATIAQYLFRINIGIDELLFQDLSPGATYPGRPSPRTSLGFILTGISLLLAGGRGFWVVRISQFLAVTVGFMALVAIVGYVYSALPFYGISNFTGMAIHTALSFLFIAVGTLFVNSERGLAAVFTSRSKSGHLARQLVPAIIIIPIVLGILSRWGERRELFSAETGMAADVTLHIVLLGAELWLFALFLDRADAARDKAVAAMNRRSAQLEAANQELQALSHAVPLNLLPSLKSIARLVDSMWADDGIFTEEKVKGSIAAIKKSMASLNSSVDDLLMLSQVSNAGMHRETVDMSNLAETLLADLSRAHPGHNVEFVVAPGLVVDGDGPLLRLALENLLENAWKFSSRVTEPKIEFKSKEDDGEIIYYVHDNGVGFDMVNAGALFRPFQRLHQADDFPGTGIGLAIVQRIIRRHGGQIWVNSKAGEGTTFYFTLS